MLAVQTHFSHGDGAFGLRALESIYRRAITRAQTKQLRKPDTKTQQLGMPHSHPVEGLAGNQDANSVYRLDIKTSGVSEFERWAWNFDYSLAILKCGTDLVFFQSFSRAYNLGEWLTASGRLSASKCAEMYSPFSQPAKLGSTNEWLRQLNRAILFFYHMLCSDFEPLARLLFGSGLALSFRGGGTPPPEIALSDRWRRYGLKPVPAPL